MPCTRARNSTLSTAHLAPTSKYLLAVQLVPHLLSLPCPFINLSRTSDLFLVYAVVFQRYDRPKLLEIDSMWLCSVQHGSLSRAPGSSDVANYLIRSSNFLQKHRGKLSDRSSALGSTAGYKWTTVAGIRTSNEVPHQFSCIPTWRCGW
jgi:hypothetical protein